MIICESSTEEKIKQGSYIEYTGFIYLYRLQLFMLIKQAMLAEVLEYSYTSFFRPVGTDLLYLLIKCATYLSKNKEFSCSKYK